MEVIAQGLTTSIYYYNLHSTMSGWENRLAGERTGLFEFPESHHNSLGWHKAQDAAIVLGRICFCM